HVEHHCVLAARAVLLQHARVLDGHLPPAEGRHARAEPPVLGVEDRVVQRAVPLTHAGVTRSPSGARSSPGYPARSRSRRHHWALVPRRDTRLAHAHAVTIGRSLLAGIPGSLTLTPSRRPGRSPGGVPGTGRGASRPPAHRRAATAALARTSP